LPRNTTTASATRLKCWKSTCTLLVNTCPDVPRDAIDCTDPVDVVPPHKTAYEVKDASPVPPLATGSASTITGSSVTYSTGGSSTNSGGTGAQTLEMRNGGYSGAAGVLV